MPRQFRMRFRRAAWPCVLAISAGVANSAPGGGMNLEGSNMDAPQTHKHTNRLIKATSPYLLQHAHNPVDWHEWGAEALAQAKREDKPIFLSIGYSACHWCHVMEHECFEDEEVADFLNGHFVSIKVDREERPDIDSIYMAYTQALTNGGGWPMSVWLTPDSKPFHAGTYFPKQQFLPTLAGIASSWENEREGIIQASQGTDAFFAEWSSGSEAAEGVVSQDEVVRAANALAGYFDRELGGIGGGGSNKFPPTMAMDLLLRVHRHTGAATLLDAVTLTLDHMARGGIYDHLGGGICRYSTDSEWLVPHFEKMLYDQATVSYIYLDAYQATRTPLYAQTAADIFDYVLADLAAPGGGFYSSRDADSDGLEGAFYIWTIEQVDSVLGEKDGRLFREYYDVTATGNWFEALGHAPAGPKNILHVTSPPQEFAKRNGLDPGAFLDRLGEWRTKLLAERAKRTPPGLDDKILTSWNGLMIASLAKGSRVLGEPKYAVAAEKAARFILDNLRKDGRLLRTHRRGDSRLMAYLDDYAFMIHGLLNLYEATFDRKWLDESVALADTLTEYYFHKEGGAFFFTASDAEELVARAKHPHDGAIPSGNAVHAHNLLKLAILYDRKDYTAKAESIFRAFGKEVSRMPNAYTTLLGAADFYHDRVKEIAVIGDLGSPDTAALLKCVYERYLPNKVVVHASTKGDDLSMPLLKGKTRTRGRATAYVCEKYNCKLPVTTPEDFARQLDAK